MMGKVDCYYFKTRVSYGGLSMDCDPYCSLRDNFCPVYEHGDTCDMQLHLNEVERKERNEQDED